MDVPQGHRDVHVVLASQVVRDVKVGGGAQRRELSKDTARLRSGLRDRNYIPGDKVNCEFRPLYFTNDGALMVEIFGGMLRGSDADTSLDPHFHHFFHLDLKAPLTLEQVSGMTLEDLLVQHCNDVVVDDGGNAQNMAINLCLAAASMSLRQKMHLTVFSSSDPIKRLPPAVQGRVQQTLLHHSLPGVSDRIAIHLPWEYESGKRGTFGLTTEPIDTSEALRKLLESHQEIAALLRPADSFIVCDPSFELLRSYGQPGRYNTIVNAATKWRSTVAGKVFGTDTLLPMNHKEAADVAHIIKHVGREQELHQVKRVPFPMPLKTNGNEIDQESLFQLDGMLWELTTFNHLHHRPNGLVAFNFPITFEEQGGLIVGTRNRRSIVAFTSTPDVDAERRMLEQYGDAGEMNGGEIETMGAGDAAASIVAMFNALDPQEFIEPFLEGRETSFTLLHQFAQTIFVSAMSRIVGMFLIHTKRTHMANIDLQKFDALLRSVAEESLQVARRIMRSPNESQIHDIEHFGIKAVTWPLGSIVHPDNEGLSV